MATKPTKPTAIDTWAASGTVVEPSAPKKADGWSSGEQPPYEYRNWIEKTEREKTNEALDYTEEVVDYTDQKLDGVEGGAYANENLIDVEGDDAHMVLRLKSELGRALSIEGDDAGTPAFSPFGIIPLPDHPATIIPGDIYPYGEDLYHEALGDGYRILQTKKTGQVFMYSNSAALSHHFPTTNLIYWSCDQTIDRWVSTALRPSPPDDEQLYLQYPINGNIPDRVMITKIEARIDPGVARGTISNRMQLEFYSNFGLIAYTNDNGTANTQTVTLSGLTELLDFSSSPYWINIRAGDSAFSDSVNWVKITFDAE